MRYRIAVLKDETDKRKFLSHKEFQRKFDLETPYLQYAGLICSLFNLCNKISPKYEYRKTGNTLFKKLKTHLRS